MVGTRSKPGAGSYADGTSRIPGQRAQVSQSSTQSSRRAGWGVVTVVATATGAAVAAVTGGIAMHYARRLTEPPSTLPEDPPVDDDKVIIVSLTGDHVLLTGKGASRSGVWGVTTATGYGRMGAALERVEGGIRRRFTLLDGTMQPGEGMLDAYAFVNRPDALDITGEAVLVDSEVGPLPAHHVAGDDTWVIGIHGRAAERHETFRPLETAVSAGHTALAISYRNDRDAGASPDGRSHLGGTEWRDVVAAMDHARQRGARRMVLVGCSMGGAIIGQVLAHARTDDLAGLILDSPVVDWHPIVARAARDLGVPRAMVALLIGPTTAVARARHDVDLARLRFDPQLLDVPTLLVHGATDEVVPVTGSDAFAMARPDIITYLRVPEAGHVRSWNADPATYGLAVATLLEAIA